MSTADSRSRAFVDELRSQVFQSKSQEDSERERSEQRTNQKLDEIKRSLEKYVRWSGKDLVEIVFSFRFEKDRLDKKIDDAVHQFERKTATLEDQYRRAISDLTRNNEVRLAIKVERDLSNFLFQSVEQTVYKRYDEKYQKTMANLDKVKKEMRTCFESLEGSVKTLQRITEGRIKVTEEKLDKEVEKLRNMIVII